MIQLALFTPAGARAGGDVQHAVQVGTEQPLDGLLDRLAQHNHRAVRPPAPSPEATSTACVLFAEVCDRALTCPTDHAALMAWSHQHLLRSSP